MQNGFAPTPMNSGPVTSPIASGPATDPSQAASSSQVVAAPSGPVIDPLVAHASPNAADGGFADRIAQRDARAAFANSAEGTFQRSDAMQFAALDKERQAAKDADAAIQAQNLATQEANQAHLERQAKQTMIDNARLAQDRENTDKYTQLYAQQIQDAASYKVDTDRHIGTTGLIAIAMSGIGDALNGVHGPNAALGIITESIDKRIADQWAQKKSLGDKAAGTKDVLGVYRNNADDDRQAMNFQRATELTRTADEIKQIADNYANPIQKARALQISAGLDQNAAALVATEANRKAQAISAAAAAEHARQELAIKKQDANTASWHASIANNAQKETAADNATKNAIATAELFGKLNKDAKAGPLPDVQIPSGLDANGRAVYTPAMNQDGATPFTVKRGLETEFAKGLNSAENAIDALDRLRALRQKSGGNYFQTMDARQKMAEFEQVAAAIASASGSSRISGEILKHAKVQILGNDGDPTSVWKDVMPLLDSARSDLEGKITTLMRTHGNGGYTGPAWHKADPLSVPDAPPTTVDQERLSRALTARKIDGTSIGEVEESVRKANYDHVDPANLKFISDLGLAALGSSDPKERASALRKLEAIHDGSQNDEIIDAAAREIASVSGRDITNSISDSADVTDRSHATTRESVPPPLPKAKR